MGPMEEMNLSNKFALVEQVRETAFKELEAVIGKLEKHLKIIEDERTRTNDEKQAEVTKTLAIDVVREGVREIIKKVVNKI